MVYSVLSRISKGNSSASQCQRSQKEESTLQHLEITPSGAIMEASVSSSSPWDGVKLQGTLLPVSLSGIGAARCVHDTLALSESPYSSSQ